MRQPMQAWAFSLVELLVVLGIFSILVALVAFGTQRMREYGQSTKCISNLKQIGAATAMYAADHQNVLPYYPYRTSTSVGSGAISGTWFYNLAPYLSVPRVEVSDSLPSDDRTMLGSKDAPITAPCVFTCPGHRKDESGDYWTPSPMTFPTRRPVSYSPSLSLDSAFVDRYRKERGMTATDPVDPLPIPLSAIHWPSKKIWLCDSPFASVLNVSAARWKTKEEYGSGNYPRQGFTRHNQGGNALFFDGHVEHLPLTTFTENKEGIDVTLIRYFYPLPSGID